MVAAHCACSLAKQRGVRGSVLPVREGIAHSAKRAVRMAVVRSPVLPVGQMSVVDHILQDRLGHLALLDLLAGTEGRQQAVHPPVAGWVRMEAE